MNLKQTLQEILGRIRDTNLHKDKDPIPTSDMIHRRLCGDIEPNEQRLKAYLRLLSDAHYIFIVKIVEADERLKVAGVDGYVACEVQILAKLREIAAKNLERTYASQMYQRKQAAQIVKELVPQARQFNNTPLGNYLNVSVMLQQYEHFVATSFAEFTETWKNSKLDELLRSLDPGALPDATPDQADLSPDPDSDGGASAAAALATPVRAIDHEELARIEEMDRSGNWGEAVDKFGVEFLLRIHFRKYEFEKVRILVRQRKIAREEDLRYIRETLAKLESRMSIDPGLVKYRAAIGELRRAVQTRITEIFNLKKQAQDPDEEPY